ncbi:hypothetical protein Drorol1_Dr00014591, partial [Drosera rotundifolia]
LSHRLSTTAARTLAPLRRRLVVGSPARFNPRNHCSALSPRNCSSPLSIPIHTSQSSQVAPTPLPQPSASSSSPRDVLQVRSEGAEGEIDDGVGADSDPLWSDLKFLVVAFVFAGFLGFLMFLCCLLRVTS